jgi:hypothetical protein
MTEGMLPISNGLTWVRGRGKDAATFAEDLPGTHAVLRPNRLDAWRCSQCKLVLFRYGIDEAKRRARREELREEADAEPADNTANR